MEPMEPGFFGSLFGPIESLLHFLMEALYNLTDQFGFGSYGLAIILLTIIVKVALYPLTVKQLRSMKAMQELQPELQKLQTKYKNNPQAMQMKLAELYKEKGVNPLAGCLPLLIQMPILMGMYYALFNFDYGNGGCRVCRRPIRRRSCRCWRRARRSFNKRCRRCSRRSRPRC